MSLSDLFAEREQYDWMLDTLFEVYKAHPGEDEIAMQYLNVGVCKAAAVVGVVSRNMQFLFYFILFIYFVFISYLFIIITFLFFQEA